MGALATITRQHAQPAGQPAAPQARQYLTFMVTGDAFGIPISAVKEIIEDRPATAVPMMPAFTKGVINLRGRVVPVIDLSARFGRGAAQPTRRSCIVIVEVAGEGERREIGLAVDAVNAVLDIADADIEPPPSFGSKLRAEFISGMGKLGEQFVIVLDIDKVLSHEELADLSLLEDAPRRGGAAEPAPAAEARA